MMFFVNVINFSEFSEHDAKILHFIQMLDILDICCKYRFQRQFTKLSLKYIINRYLSIFTPHFKNLFKY